MDELAMRRPSPARRWATLRSALLYAALILASVAMCVPFLWTLSTSLKTGELVLVIPPQLIPRPATLANYTRLTELFPIVRLFANSVFVAVATTAGQILASAMAAYAFARFEFRGRDALFLLFLATMMVPFQVTITPLFILMRYLGWINSYQGLIAPGVFSAFGTFLLRQFFLSLPKEFDEAAFVDGASPLTVFLDIILPLSRPALATLAVFAFMSSWNAFLWPLFVVRDTQLMTLPVGLANLQGRYLTDWSLVMAGAVITIVPMVAVYLLAQQYFIKGVVLSGLKG